VNPRVTLLLILALIYSSVFAQTPPPDGPPLPAPSYLMPITAYRPLEESVEKLLGNRWGWATMIYEGTHSDKDFVVSVWGANNKPKTLTIIRFDHNGEQAKSKSEINVPVDDDFVDAIREAWSAMLLKTRYPDNVGPVADGWTVEFSASVSRVGSAYGVDHTGRGLSKELVSFGFELRDYCEAKEKDRKVKRDSMIPRLKEFAERVKTSRLY
jgi:hypothetical protein